MSSEQPLIANRYRLLDKLGQGGMGAVYKAYDRLNQQEVALKQVLTAPADIAFGSRQDTDTELHVALAQEFRTLASLRHPNIISVLDYGFGTNRQPFFTMEYLASPQNFLEASKDSSTETKVEYLIQLLQALAYLHRHKILHRDLKPDNVLVVNGTVKALDFGLAMMRRDSAASHTESLAGTLHYIAPEQFEGRAPSRQSDLWAVGIMAYELFAGRHPFDTTNMMMLMRDLMTNTADVISLDLSDDLTVVIERLLTKSTEGRFKDAFEVIDALHRAIDDKQPKEATELRQSFIRAAKFVGRETELVQLEQALEGSIQGRGGGWLIGGESGVGKSRLMDEFRNLAMVKGALVLRGQGVEGGGLLFQLWRDVIRRLLLVIELDDLQKQILKEIVPDLGLLLGEGYTNST